MDFESINMWCWLIPLLTGLLCGIIGYLWGKGNSVVVDNSAELKSLKDKNTQLQVDLDACNKKLISKPSSSKSSDLASSSLTGETSTATTAFDANAAKAAFGKKVKQDDLKIVEGIGPKIEQLFHNHDIKTWKALSDASVSKCKEVLDSGGDRYRIHDPASWPMQAKMAYEGKWKDLITWQDEHKHGKY